ncbi:MAG: CinA family nicotinamide mononucleotide deamidase-related protein [Planctomycetota bacterium]|jgi:nicotinamide-nucleotide amidase
MRIELVSTGDELVLGQIADTNAAEIAAALEEEGLSVSRVTVVGDDRAEIARAYGEALGRADVVIATGGLGPTEDDLAREGLADALGEPLELSAEAERAVAERAARYGRPVLEADRKQAFAPRGASVMANSRGSAPGLRASVTGKTAGKAAGKTAGKTIYVLPGVPHEMRGMLREAVLPEVVAAAAGSRCALRHLVVHGMPEAEVATRLAGLAREGLGVGTRTRAGVITVRLRAVAATVEEAGRLAGEAADEARKRLGDAVAGEGDKTLGCLVAETALAKGLTVAVAESCTGGLVAAALVAVPGVSDALVEGWVTYSNDAKVRRLDVPASLIAAKGAVSREVAVAMAEGARTQSGADVALAVTGIAGPGGGTPEKPVGLVHFAVASAAGTEPAERRFKGSRDVVRRRATEVGLGFLLGGLRRAAAAVGG